MFKVVKLFIFSKPSLKDFVQSSYKPFLRFYTNSKKSIKCNFIDFNSNSFSKEILSDFASLSFKSFLLLIKIKKNTLNLSSKKTNW